MSVDQTLAALDEYREEGRRAGRFRLFHARELEVRAPRWLVRGLLEADCLAMVFADPGAGKSFFAIDVACCVATGVEFHGLPVQGGPVIYIAGEGLNGLARRLRAWEIRRQALLAKAPFYVSMGPAAMCHPSSANEVAAAVEAIALEHGEPALVVLDTVARNFGPGDENSTMDMTGFIAAVDVIRSKHQTTVLLVHHTGHADKSRARGAMALHGALDAAYRMDKDEAGVVRLEATKMKDAPEPQPMAFRICSVELGIEDNEGVQVTSAVLDSTSYEPPPAPGKIGRGKWQTVALEVLDRLQAQQPDADGSNPAEAPRVTLDAWRSGCIDADMPKQRFYDVKDTLVEHRLVEISHGFVLSGSGSGSVRSPIGRPDRTGLPNPGVPDRNRTANRTQSGPCARCDGEGCGYCRTEARA